MKLKSKKSKLLLSSLALLTSGVVAATTAGFIVVNNNSKISKTNADLQADISDLIPAEVNDQNAILSTTQGPVTFWGNTITALDWYGAELWNIDMAEYNVGSNGLTGSSAVYTGTSWTRAWFNWDYNRSTNTIWVLGYFGGSNTNQKLFAINAQNGEITKTIELGKTILTGSSADNAPRFISALASGNVLIYGTAAITYNATAYLYNDSTNSVAKITGDSTYSGSTVNWSAANGKGSGNTGNWRWYWYNLVPVANNINIVTVMSFSTVSTTDDATAAKHANYNVYMILVDDNLNFIGTGDFADPVLISEGMVGYRNTQITPQRDYYINLNGNVNFVTYRTVVTIDPSNTSNIKFYLNDLGSDVNWVKTWAVDANENLYFKFKSDGKIFKVDSSLLQSSSASSLTPTTYLDLTGIYTDDIYKYAQNMMVYNVYGYTGQLLLINQYDVIYVKSSDPLTDNSSTLWGLAIAVTQNSSSQSTGDYLGLLNTSDSILHSADFDIDASVLNSKIPSEITRDDLTLLNDGFFQEGDANYEPFKVEYYSSDENREKNYSVDVEGTFSVTVNLYQIPWFASSLPSNSTPKTITKSFTTSNKITDKLRWTSLNTSNHYDFLNTLPTNVTASDIANLDPLIVSFQSQEITDASGNVLYPKKTYGIRYASHSTATKTYNDPNDDTGEITIWVTLKYVPMGITYTDGSGDQVLSFTTSHTYTIFKKTDASGFYYMGQSTGNETTLDVKDIPQLKNLTEANVLPSSFDYLNNSSDTTNSDFLQFINTALSGGYPISKMTFSVESDDINGTLTITGTMPSSYSPNQVDETFTITYTGLNKISDYGFSFNTNANTIGNTSFNDLLPSSVTTGNVLSYLVSYTGFNSNDFTINLTPDDTSGTLIVAVNLASNYAENIGSSGHGFTNYVSSYTFSGFMTTDVYNNRFNLEFISDEDAILLDLKSMQLQEVYDKLVGDGASTPEGLTVSGVTYANLNDLVENLLLSSIGSAIPTDWASSSDITTELYYDNNLGICSVLVTIPKSILTGSSSDLYFVYTYTGFVNGNIDTTNDNMSFVPTSLIKSYLVAKGYFSQAEVDELTPSTFKEWIETGDNIKNLITYVTGEYITKLNNNDFELTIVANDIQKNISITIDYGTLLDSLSLSSYSVQYVI